MSQSNPLTKRSLYEGMSYEMAYCIFCMRRGLDANKRDSEAFFRTCAAHVMELPFRWFTDGPFFEIPDNLCVFTPLPSEEEPEVGYEYQ